MVDWTGAVLRDRHVASGFAGLVAFRITVMSRKGDPVHVRCSRWFVPCVWIVLPAIALCARYYPRRLNDAAVSVPGAYEPAAWSRSPGCASGR